MQLDASSAPYEEGDYPSVTLPTVSPNRANKRERLSGISVDTRAPHFSACSPHGSCATKSSIPERATPDSSRTLPNTLVDRVKPLRPLNLRSRNGSMSYARHHALDGVDGENMSKLRLLTGLDKKFLRGVSNDVILAKFAQVFANSNGTKEEYEKSENVHFLDAFISHSWRDSRWQKWIALLFHFNFPMALRVACMTAVFLFVLLLLVFALIPASLEDITAKVSINRAPDVIELKGFFIREALDNWKGSINSTLAIYPTNKAGCKPWEDVAGFDLRTVESKKIVLMLQLEGCSIRKKMNSLQSYLSKVDAGNNTARIDLVVIYSEMFIVARHSLAQRLLLEINDYFGDGDSGSREKWSPLLLIKEEFQWKKMFCRDNQCAGIRIIVPNPGKSHCPLVTKRCLAYLFRIWNLRWYILLVSNHIPAIMFFIILLFWHHSDPKSVFLDKLCINQESDYHIQQGVQALPVFLHFSKRLVVFWTETYFTRLWCVYEVARFLATHDTNEVDICPVSLCVLVVGSCAATWIMLIVVDLFVFMQPFLVDPVFCMLNSGRIPSTQKARMGWQLPICFLIFWFIIFFNVTLFRAAGRAHRLLKTQVQRFCFDSALCSKTEDRYAIESDLGKWFAEGGLAESRAFRAVAVAVLAKVQSRESIKQEGCVEMQPVSKVSILTPWKRKQGSNGPSSGVKPSGDVTAPVEDAVRKILKQERISDSGVFDGLSADHQRRAFELWVRTGVFQDISSFLGAGATLKFKWIMYSILPVLWSVPLGHLLDPFSPGIGLYSMEHMSRSITIAYCIIPLFCLFMNHLYASKRLYRASKWVRRKLYSTKLLKRTDEEEPGVYRPTNSFARNIYTNLLYALLGTSFLVTLGLGTLFTYAYAGIVYKEVPFLVPMILLLLFVCLTVCCFHYASRSNPQFDIPLDVDDLFVGCPENEFSGFEARHSPIENSTCPTSSDHVASSCVHCQSMILTIRQNVSKSLARYGCNLCLGRECDEIGSSSASPSPLCESAVFPDIVALPYANLRKESSQRRRRRHSA